MKHLFTHTHAKKQYLLCDFKGFGLSLGVGEAPDPQLHICRKSVRAKWNIQDYLCPFQAAIMQ